MKASFSVGQLPLCRPDGFSRNLIRATCQNVWLSLCRRTVKMYCYFILLSALLLTTQAGPTTTSNIEFSTTSPTTEMNLCPCVNNANTTQPPNEPANKMPNILIHGMTCLCHAGPSHGSVARDDYRYSPGIGAHKLHTRAATWNEARKMCNEEGGHLAIINSLSESHVLMDLFAKAGPTKGASYEGLAFIGIHDLYKEGEWVTILGESLFKTGYTQWSDKWGGQPDNGAGVQNCGSFLKEGGIDDVNCDVPFPFFCELPMTYIIH